MRVCFNFSNQKVRQRYNSSSMRKSYQRSGFKVAYNGKVLLSVWVLTAQKFN
jgi:hypothetical protein